MSSSERCYVPTYIFYFNMLIYLDGQTFFAYVDIFQSTQQNPLAPHHKNNLADSSTSTQLLYGGIYSNKHKLFSIEKALCKLV